MNDRLDKSVFQHLSFEQADDNIAYWKTKSPYERLIAGYRLSMRTYGYDPDHPPRMDKKYFRMIKR